MKILIFKEEIYYDNYKSTEFNGLVYEVIIANGRHTGSFKKDIFRMSSVTSMFIFDKIIVHETQMQDFEVIRKWLIANQWQMKKEHRYIEII